ncbi:flavin reductase family protein [Haloimpatiens sp. FM7315]|uniref:flavin reductase family protein n=1 Tax=Haloimpatiens sp. FM7315 TaxID=3298609 RepID=UPI0035A3A14A
MEFDYTENLVEVLKSLQKRGAFLTVKDKDGKVNTMTIGWGNIGYDWGKPVFSVLVRESRYTYELIENAEDFTVSVPLDDDLKSALAFCGSKSGKNFNKFNECNLKAIEGKTTKSPVIDNCGMVYECKIVYKHVVEAENIKDETKEKWYKSGDMHRVYYGEITNCYINK